jgi:hypothetical protein
MRIYGLGLALLFSVSWSISASAAGITYKNVDYNDQADFMATAATLGTQGFELINCVDTGSTQYTANGTDNTGQMVTYGGMLTDRTSYCVFKQATGTFQYQTWDYTTQADFTAELATMGNQGWELATCLTTGGVNYSASGTGFLNNLILSRTSYCVFKK